MTPRAVGLLTVRAERKSGSFAFASLEVGPVRFDLDLFYRFCHVQIGPLGYGWSW